MLKKKKKKKKIREFIKVINTDIKDRARLKKK